jgi:hypothetical protein
MLVLREFAVAGKAAGIVVDEPVRRKQERHQNVMSEYAMRRLGVIVMTMMLVQ